MIKPLPMDPPPPKPRYVLLWRAAQQVRVSEWGDGRYEYDRFKWEWEWHALAFARGADLTRQVRHLVRVAGDRYAGECSGSTGYRWESSGTVTLGDVEMVDLRTNQRTPVAVLARIRRAAAKARAERNQWLRDYAETQRAEKLEALNRLKRELGEP